MVNIWVFVIIPHKATAVGYGRISHIEYHNQYPPQAVLFVCICMFVQFCKQKNTNSAYEAVGCIEDMGKWKNLNDYVRDFTLICYNRMSLWHYDPSFATEIFKCVFFSERISFIQTSLQFVVKGTIENKTALVQVMTLSVACSAASHYCIWNKDNLLTDEYTCVSSFQCVKHYF